MEKAVSQVGTAFIHRFFRNSIFLLFIYDTGADIMKISDNCFCTGVCYLTFRKELFHGMEFYPRAHSRKRFFGICELSLEHISC